MHWSLRWLAAARVTPAAHCRCLSTAAPASLAVTCSPSAAPSSLSRIYPALLHDCFISPNTRVRSGFIRLCRTLAAPSCASPLHTANVAYSTSSVPTLLHSSRILHGSRVLRKTPHGGDPSANIMSSSTERSGGSGGDDGKSAPATRKRGRPPSTGKTAAATSAARTASVSTTSSSDGARVKRPYTRSSASSAAKSVADIADEIRGIDPEAAVGPNAAPLTSGDVSSGLSLADVDAARHAAGVVERKAVARADAAVKQSGEAAAAEEEDEDGEGETYSGKYELTPDDLHRHTSARLHLPLAAVRFVLTQAKSGATVPFLARYRQGETGRMDEVQLRLVLDTAKEVAEVHRRRQFMLKSLESRGLLTPALQAALMSMLHVSQLEDAWEPFKERRTSLASRGRAAGLGPYAAALLTFDAANADCRAWLAELSAVLRRTEDGERLLVAIVAEDVQRSEELRRRVGEYCRHTARLTSSMLAKPRKKVAKELQEEDFETLRKHFAFYDGKSWSVQRVAAHVVLALQRGEARGALKVDVESGPKSRGVFMYAARELYAGLNRLLATSPSPTATTPSSASTAHAHDLREAHYARRIAHEALQSAYEHLVKQCHTAVRRDLKKSAEQEAIVVFAHNLHHMLLQRPLSKSRLLAMDPGLANGVKCVALDEQGTVETFFTCTLMDEPKMRRYVTQVVESKRLNKIVIGNGTASSRTADLVADLIKTQKWTDVEFAIVSEAGASVYSISDIAKEEFPDLGVMYRGAVNIGRRVLDPLSELVKIPVRSMGIGMYQHDVNEKDLMRELNYVLESCVAKVGINAASANRYVMEKVPGIQKKIVDQIVLARHARRLRSREDLRRVPAMTDGVYEQVAGFFRFPSSPEPLDNTNIHPESYALVRRLMELYTAGQLGGPAEGTPQAPHSGPATRSAADAAADAQVRQAVAQRLGTMSAAQLAALASRQLACAVETLELVRQELQHPGLDPRAALPHAGLLRREVGDVKELRAGQLLSGVVQSVTMFGAFVDCGLHDTVLVRGEGTDALQVGMYLDQRIRFEALDHLKRPRAFLVRDAAAQGGGEGGGSDGRGSTGHARRLRLESEDVLRTSASGDKDGANQSTATAWNGPLCQGVPGAAADSAPLVSALGEETTPSLIARVLRERCRRRTADDKDAGDAPLASLAARKRGRDTSPGPSRQRVRTEEASAVHDPAASRGASATAPAVPLAAAAAPTNSKGAAPRRAGAAGDDADAVFSF